MITSEQAQEAAKIHSTFTTFSIVHEIMESGNVYGSECNHAIRKIQKICKEEMNRLLSRHDVLVEREENVL